MSEARPAQRRDAARNRARILEVAAEVMAARGIDISMEEVAAAVGVGVGTLYRHFGSKAALVEALFESSIDGYLEKVAELSHRPRAWDGLCAVLRFLVETQAREPGTLQALYGRVDTAADVIRERVAPVLADLVARAKSEGALRADFAATDIPIVTFALGRLAVVPDLGPTLARRTLELYLKGLRPGDDPAPVPPPLLDDDFGAWFRVTVGGR